MEPRRAAGSAANGKAPSAQDQQGHGRYHGTDEEDRDLTRRQ